MTILRAPIATAAFQPCIASSCQEDPTMLPTSPSCWWACARRCVCAQRPCTIILRRITTILVLTCVAAPMPAVEPEDLPEGWDDWRFIPYAEARFSSEADTTDEHGELGVSRGRLGLRVEKIPALFLHLGFNAEIGVHTYSGSIAGEDLDLSTRSGDLAFTPTLRFHEQWSAFVPLGLSAGWVEHGPGEESLTSRYGIGIQYHRSMTQRVGIGAVALDRLEDETVVLPFITADWRFDEHWRLLILDPVDGISRLRYALTPVWDLGLRVSTELSEFRLANDNVLADDHVALAVECGRNPQHGPSLHGFLGVVAWREVTVRSGHGDEILQDTLEPALHAGIDARWSF
jgi:hypothetical protein